MNDCRHRPHQAIRPSGHPDLKLLRRLQAAQIVCLAFVCLVAAPVLCAWEVPGLASLMPNGWSVMKADTALGMLLVVASLSMSRALRSDNLLLASRVLGLWPYYAAAGGLAHQRP